MTIPPLAVVLCIVLGVQGCAAPRTTTDTSAASAATSRAPAHDPALHAGHVAAGAASSHGGDSAFTALQARGAAGMGVDQYTSTHTFEPLANGGRITLRRNMVDSAGAEAIRMHLRTIAAAFAAGNFATPGFVHADSVPGTDVMAAKRSAIQYSVAPIARGGELRITTSDRAALEAIHRFLAYQRREHRAGDGAIPPPP